MLSLRRFSLVLTVSLVVLVATPLRAVAPTLSAIAPVTIAEDTNSGAIAFTITDPDTDVDTLVLSATSSNPTVVADGAISFAGTGENRTVSFQPVANAVGTTTITLSAFDGAETGTTTIDVTITAVDDPPSVSDIVDLSTPEDVATGAIPFTVADIDTVLDSLLLSVSSDNAVLLPPGNLVLGGSGASRTLTLTPAPDVHGTATVTVQVSDGTTVASDTFVLTVTPVNDPPTLSDIGPQITSEATPTAAIPFTVDDVDGGVATLTVSGGSDNATLVPPANIVFGGTGANRTVTVTPAAGQSGLATITVTVSDGTASADDTFTVTVSAVDDPPTITDIGPQAIAEDGSTGAIAFLVDDPDTPVATLAVAATSDNATLVPPAGIALGGSNPSRTITVTPAADQHGSATITVTVSDGTTLASDTFLLTVTSANDPPTITDIGPQVVDEDTSTGTIAFTVGDPDTALAGLLVTATSDNATLVPPASIALGGADASRTIAILPAANASGSATITVTVTDGTTPVSDTFTLTVNAVNDVPSITAIADQTIDEDTSSPALAFTVGDVETAAASLATSVSASNAVLFPPGSMVLGGAGASRTLTLTPAPGLNGNAVITLSVTDGNATTTSTTFAAFVTPVDDPPTLAAIADQTTPEDTALGIGLLVGDPDTTLSLVTVTATSSDQVLLPSSNLAVAGTGASRTLTMTPAPNRSGAATITVTADDGTSTAVRTFVLTVTAVNDAPTIGAIGPQQTDEDTVLGPIAFAVGDVETAAASLIVTAASSNQGVIADGDIVIGGSGASRSITITPVANASGIATVTVTVSDGQASTPSAFQVEVVAVNDAPTITAIANQSINEDTSTPALAFTVADAETAAGSLTVTATSDNQVVLPNAGIVLGGAGSANRTITLTPASNQVGSANVTVTVSDGPASAIRVFTLTVQAVNDLPTFAGVPAVLSFPEDSSAGPIAFTVADVDHPVASLLVSVASNNATLLPAPSLALAGSNGSYTLTLTPVANRSGVATVTITASDAQGSSTAQIAVTVTAVNDPPTISNIGDASVNQGAPTPPVVAGFTIGDIDSTLSCASVTAMSSNTSLVPNANLVVTGTAPSCTLTATPVTPLQGTTTISVTVSDGTLTANDTFVLTVNPPDAPTVSDIPNQSIAEDTTLAPVAFTVGDDTPLSSLVVTAQSSDQTLVPNGALVLAGSGASRTIAATPVANRNGETTITITVRDGTNLEAQDSFVLTVTRVNDTPTLAAIGPQSTSEDTARDVVLTLGDVDLADAPADELAVAVTSSNATLVPNAPANLQVLGSGTTRTLRITPAPDQSGNAQITVTVTDAALASAQRVFTLTVNAVNDAPTLSGAPTSVTFDEDTSTVLSALTVGDVETPVGSLSLSVVSSNAALLPVANVVFGGSGASRTATITPVPDAFGTATLTITVSDGVATSSSGVIVTVAGVNDAPVIGGLSATAATDEDTAATVDYVLSDIDSTVACGPGNAVSAASSNPTLLPVAGIALTSLGGTACRLTLTPAANASGLSTVTLTATDGALLDLASFDLDVAPVNDAPTISAILAQSTPRDTPTPPIAFAIGDVDDPLSGLTTSAQSSNDAVVNDGASTSYKFDGTGASRTLIVTPFANATGTTDITVTVHDGANATASRTFALTVTAVSCTYVVTTEPSVLAFVALDPVQGRQAIVSIATQAGCPWSVSVPGGATWLTVSAANGTGDGALLVSAGANTGATNRATTLTVNGGGTPIPIAVTQSGAACAYSLAPSLQSVSTAAGAATFTLTSTPGCAWSATSSQPAWAPVRPPSSGTVGSSGTVALTVDVAANTGGARSATISAGGATATIQQAGNCSLSTSPARLAFGAAGGVSLVQITAPQGCEWTAVSAAAWAPVSVASGFGNGAISVTVGDNSGGAPRDTKVTVALKATPAVKQEITVAQDSPTTGDADGDGMPSAWEAQFGLNATSEAGQNGALGDPDGDGVNNLQEMRNGTHPRGFAANTRYLAEGASSTFFETRFALFNPGDTSAIVLMRFQRKGTTPASQYLVIPAKARRTVISTSVPDIATAEFSTLVESDTQVIVDRTLSWGNGRYGSHAETSVVAPRTTWYLAEGATHSNFDLFYLLQNPGTTPSKVRVTFLLPVGAPIVRDYDLPPNSRDNIWVDQIPGLENTDVSAVFEVTQGPAILVERALYLTPPGGATFVAGHDASAVASPQTRWFLAEGATGDFFDEFILVANPTATDAVVRATFLLTTGQNIVKTYNVAKNSRFNIWVDVADPALAQAEVSAIVESTNNVPIIVERALWWPGPTFSTWSEAHVSAGTTTTGTRWALAEGEQGGAFNTATYVLVANTSPRAGTARATLYFEDGSAPVSKDFALAASSRNNIAIGAEFAVAGKRFSVVIESIGTNPVQVVVERAMYSDAAGVFWAAGSNAVATKLQ